MDTTEHSDDHFIRPVNDSDHVDLVGAASRRSPRVRTMLWATLSPDGMDRTAFGRRAYVHDAALKAQSAAFRAGFLPFYEGEGTIDQQRMRITHRWQEEYRPGFAALTDRRLRAGDQPGCREGTAALAPTGSRAAQALSRPASFATELHFRILPAPSCGDAPDR